MFSICKAWFPQNHGPSIRVVIPLAAVLLPWRNSSMACIKGHAAKPFKASVHVTCHGLLDQSKILKKVILFSQKSRVSDFSEVRNDGIWAHKCLWTLSGTRQQFLFFVLATFLSLQVKRKQLMCQYLLRAAFGEVLGFFLQQAISGHGVVTTTRDPWCRLMGRNTQVLLRSSDIKYTQKGSGKWSPLMQVKLRNGR